MIHLTSEGLRKIAGYLDQLGHEEGRGIVSHGHSGSTEITLVAEQGPDSVLRVVRINLPPTGDDEVGPVAYALEVGD